MSLAVGHGENNFTMSRGSFKYHQHFDWKSECDLISTNDIENGFVLLYQIKNSNNLYKLIVTKIRGQIEVQYEENPDNDKEVNRYWLTLKTNPSEHIYGCGETYSEFDLKGQKVRIWVAEHQNTSRIAKKIIKEKLFGKHPEKKLNFNKYESYYVQPTFVSSDKYFVHVFANEYAEFDFTRADSITLYTQEPPHFYSERAESFEELSKKLSNILGRQGKLPDWIYEGGILAMQDWTFDGKATHEGFDGCGNIDRKLEALEKKNAKVVGVWCQDWCGCRCTDFGYQVMWNWEYSKEQYPNLPEKIAEWRKKGVRFLGYINPFIALEKEVYAEAKEKGYCVKDKNGDDYLVTITTFPAAMIDFTNPKAYEWYKDLIKKNMIGIGMGGWMADFGEYLPVDAVLYDGDPKVLHNQWPAIWAKLNREAIEECNAEEEVFFFTRAGHTGTIAASTMMWTGDQHVDWSIDDGLPSVIPATLSLAMSGYGITHSDVGGYTTIMSMRRTSELLLRWMEMNAYSPLFRSHEGNQPVNDVQFYDDDVLLLATAKATRVHAALANYLMECVAKQEKDGTPVMRPLFYHYDEDRAFTEKSEYLLGREILVAPITKDGARAREVYFPKDNWVHVNTGKLYHGGLAEVEAEIGQPPVFIRQEYLNTTEGAELLKKIKDAE